MIWLDIIEMICHVRDIIPAIWVQHGNFPKCLRVQLTHESQPSLPSGEWMDRCVHTHLLFVEAVECDFFAKLCKSIHLGLWLVICIPLHCCNVRNHPSKHEHGIFLCHSASQCCPTILSDSKESVLPASISSNFHPYHAQKNRSITFNHPSNKPSKPKPTSSKPSPSQFHPP